MKLPKAQTTKLLLIELRDSLGFAVNSISVDFPSTEQIDDAFMASITVYIWLDYILSNDFNTNVEPLPFWASDKYARLSSRIKDHLRSTASFLA